ncbi:RNA polymerase sigma factor [compost metagenome]
MKDNYRIILELYHMRQLSYQEIADILEIPIRTVETRLYRAKQQFERLWTEVQVHEKTIPGKATPPASKKRLDNASSS